MVPRQREKVIGALVKYSWGWIAVEGNCGDKCRSDSIVINYIPIVEPSYYINI